MLIPQELQLSRSNSKTLNKEKLSHPLKKEIFPFKEFISFITFVLVF